MPSKTRKPAGIQVGALVRIARPLFFVRCGYPMTFQSETVKVLAERGEEIKSFLLTQGVALDHLFRMHRAVEKVAKAVAYELCKQQGFGGRKREIYRIKLPEYAGRQFNPQGVRFVKTGTYEPGRHYDSMDGAEYDPPVLLDEQTHRILMTPWHDRGFILPFGVLEIEAANVEVVPYHNGEPT